MSAFLPLALFLTLLFLASLVAFALLTNLLVVPACLVGAVFLAFVALPFNTARASA